MKGGETPPACAPSLSGVWVRLLGNRPTHLKRKVCTDGEGRRNSALRCATAVRRLGKQPAQQPPPSSLPVCAPPLADARTALSLQPQPASRPGARILGASTGRNSLDPSHTPPPSLALASAAPWTLLRLRHRHDCGKDTMFLFSEDTLLRFSFRQTLFYYAHHVPAARTLVKTAWRRTRRAARLRHVRSGLNDRAPNRGPRASEGGSRAQGRGAGVDPPHLGARGARGTHLRLRLHEDQAQPQAGGRGRSHGAAWHSDDRGARRLQPDVDADEHAGDLLDGLPHRRLVGRVVRVVHGLSARGLPGARAARHDGLRDGPGREHEQLARIFRRLERRALARVARRYGNRRDPLGPRLRGRWHGHQLRHRLPLLHLARGRLRLPLPHVGPRLRGARLGPVPCAVFTCLPSGRGAMFTLGSR